MAASAFGAGADRPSENRATHGSANSGAAFPDPQLLESVLRETLLSGVSGQPLAAEDWQSLRNVVSRHRGAPFSRTPIVSELVVALLRARLTSWNLSDAAQAEVTSLIAETLYEDVASRERLRILWERLCQMPWSETPA